MKLFFFKLSKWVLPQYIRKKLFHYAFNIAFEEFQLFSYRYANAPNMELSLKEISDRGLALNSILDIGAFEGEWSRIAKSVWPDAAITMIEANKEKEQILTQVSKDLNAELHISLLGAEDDKQVEFSVMESGSSVFDEVSAFDRKKQVRQLQKLDSLLPSDAAYDLIKIDTQGYELEILKGASRLLRTTNVVLLETSLIEVNKGVPLLDEVLVFMKQRGFVTYEIVEIHRRLLDRAMNQVDILFVREGSSLIAIKSFT